MSNRDYQVQNRQYYAYRDPNEQLYPRTGNVPVPQSRDNNSDMNRNYQNDYQNNKYSSNNNYYSRSPYSNQGGQREMPTPQSRGNNSDYQNQNFEEQNNNQVFNIEHDTLTDISATKKALSNLL